MSRTGKIARLPREIREELNRRLDDNRPGKELIHWLNSLPEVKEALAVRTGENPVTEQNLSEWRQGAFAAWQMRREWWDHLRESSADADDCDAISPAMAEKAAKLIAARFLVAIGKWNGDATDPVLQELKQLSSLARAVAALRRSEHSAARAEMELHAFNLASEARAVLPKDMCKRPVVSPVLRKWTTRFGIPDPGPLVEPLSDTLVEKIRALTHSRRDDDGPPCLRPPAASPAPSPAPAPPPRNPPPVSHTSHASRLSSPSSEISPTDVARGHYPAFTSPTPDPTKSDQIQKPLRAIIARR